MFRGISGRKVYLGAVGGIAAALLGLAACNGGDTDNGTASDDAGPGQGLVSDGGFGASINIRLVDEDINVGETVGFFVELRDPNGAPLPFIRVFCESERGIAIIEPSSGGTAFESTGEDGNLSGRLGGLLPGSYLLECRAQQGFNLVDRVTMRISGPVPVGFQGFPGAAGGNLGGGSIVDETPGVDDGNGVRITEITFQSAGGDSSVLDLTRDLDCDDDATTTDDAENFVFPTYKVTVENRTQTSITIDSVQLRIADSGPDGTTSVARTVVIAAGTTGTVSGNLATTAGCASQGFFCNSGTGTTSLDLCYPGSGDQVQPGTHNVTATVSGSNENGDDFDVSSRTSITWDCVNNCS